jgi:hypothetical protein
MGWRYFFMSNTKRKHINIDPYTEACIKASAQITGHTDSTTMILAARFYAKSKGVDMNHLKDESGTPLDTPEDTEGYLSVTEVARLTGASVHTIQKAAQTQEEGRKVRRILLHGNVYLCNLEDVKALNINVRKRRGASQA